MIGDHAPQAATEAGGPPAGHAATARDDGVASGPKVRLAAIREEPLSVPEVLDAVADAAAGGHGLFVGTVRDHDSARTVTGLTYSAHPSAVEHLERVVADVASDPDVLAAAAVHRVGDLAVGDLAVVVAVSAAHRGVALDACRVLIDTLKAEVPIWKHQTFADGGQEWVGTP